MRRNPVFIKLTQWEHWPIMAYYLPLLPFFFWRSLKAGHPFFFTVTNPSILFSGVGTESKFQTLSLLPDSLKPESLLVKKNTAVEKVFQQLRSKGFSYPIIAKPDIGFRGYLVKKINSEEHLLSYLSHVDEAIILQEFIPYEKELGIFYHRIPGEESGKITSVTIKKFIKIKGDGIQTIAQLITNDDRAFLYQDLFYIIHQDKLNTILPLGEELTLSVIGNHSKGTQFINGNHLIDEKLQQLVDSICKKIEGWNYGRLDIKYRNYEALLEGESFKILEINGIISEPTHIYDASYKGATYLKALVAINNHWSIMAKIARKLHKDKKIPYPGVVPYLKNILWLRTHTKKLKKLNTKDF
ncbi:hypothetical protein [Lutimonas sp.]|uniref:hypothetical protein n=1 Tax=Lutimonas sp. TaxID=1872403 RepID=UPI003D9AC482